MPFYISFVLLLLDYLDYYSCLEVWYALMCLHVRTIILHISMEHRHVADIKEVVAKNTIIIL